LEETLKESQIKSKLVGLLIVVMGACAPLFKKMGEERFKEEVSVSKVINRLKANQPSLKP